MSEELYFNDELRKCLNAAGLSDCGENDAWNYWYHRVHKAHDQAVDRVTEAQRAENAKLRELCEDMLSCIEIQIAFDRTPKKRMYKEFAGRARELGIEVDE